MNDFLDNLAAIQYRKTHGLKKIMTKENKMQALIYSNDSQECERAESLLKSIGQDVKVFLLGDDFTQNQFNAEFGEDAEYPQISVGLNYRGSLKETLQYFKNQKVL